MFKRIKKYLFITLGSLSAALGVIGIFIPVLPTTPFLLLALFFYIRSSSRLYKRLINNKILGAYIYNYVTYKAVLKSTKIFGIVFLWAGIIISMLLIENWHVRALLLVVGIAVSIHILTLKTIEKSQMKKYSKAEEPEGIL